MFPYFKLLKENPPKGKVGYGEIEIKRGEGCHAQGNAGVVFENDYLTVVQDSVIFPSRAEGSHLRLIQGDPSQTIFGSVVLAMKPHKDREPDIAWVRQWRHARDGWMTEIPRGGIFVNEPPAKGAVRELMEETGLGLPDGLIYMEDLVSDSGISTTACSYFLAVYMREAQLTIRGQEAKEAISQVFWAPLSEWLRIAQDSTLTHGRPLGGLDSFTTSAIGLAHITGILPQAKAAWEQVFSGSFLDSPKLSSELRQCLQDPNTEEFNVTASFPHIGSAKDSLMRIPLTVHSPLDSANVSFKRISRFLISWLTLTPDVQTIR